MQPEWITGIIGFALVILGVGLSTLSKKAKRPPDRICLETIAGASFVLGILVMAASVFYTLVLKGG